MPQNNTFYEVQKPDGHLPVQSMYFMIMN